MHSVNNADEGMTHTRSFNPRCSFPSRSNLQAPSKPIRSNMPRSQESSQSSPSTENINPDINLDFKENSPFQEGVISEGLSKDWTNHSFKNPKN